MVILILRIITSLGGMYAGVCVYYIYIYIIYIYIYIYIFISLYIYICVCVCVSYVRAYVADALQSESSGSH